MKTTSVRVALLLLAISLSASAFSAAGIQQPGAGIEGIVTRAGSGEPLSGVRVTLVFIPPPAPRPPAGGGGGQGVSIIADRAFGYGGPPVITSSAPAASTGASFPASSIPSVFTDNKGTFAFANLAAGSYRLAVAANGYLPQEYGKPNQLSLALGSTGTMNLQAGQTMTGLAFNLTPTGNVGGRVLDLSGHPLAGIPVNLYRVEYNANGDRNPLTVATVRTNDRGEYRIFWIAPGRYYLIGGGRTTQGNPQTSVTNDVQDNFSFAFYPHGSDLGEAGALDIHSGDDIGGANFRIGPQPLFTIGGRLVDSRTGLPPANGSVSIAGRSPTGARSFGGRTYYDQATGTFEVRELIPGTYNVTSVLNERGPQGQGISINTFGALSASSIVRIVDADVRDVTLSIAQSQTMSGRIQSDVPLPSNARLQVRLQPVDSALGLRFAGAQTNPDGAFTFDAGAFSAGAGDYRVAVGNGLPPGWYLKDAKLGDADALTKPVRLPAQESLNLFLSSRGGQVGGVLRNEHNQSVPRTYAVLEPEGGAMRPDLIQQMLSDPAGRFNFRNVAPGNYRLFAWEDAALGAWFDPEWIKEWEPKGVPVSVGEGANETVDLKTIPGGLQ